MRLAIHSPGFVMDGINSQARGEQRWALNLAYCLGVKGHTVYLIGDMFYYNGKLVRPGWGNCPKMQNVEIYTWTDLEILKGTFDVFMDTGWNKGIDDARNNSVEATVYIHGFWGLDEQIKDPAGLVQSRSNHFYAYPTRRIVEIEDEAKREWDTSKRLFLPIPIYREWKNENNANLITWPLKECFYKDRGDSARRAKILLKAIKEIVDNDSNAEALFIGFDDEFKYADTESIEIFKSIKRKTCTPHQLPYNLCLDVMSRTKLLTTNGSPPAGPMYIESVSSGGVPICWGNSNHWGESLINLGYGLTESDPKEKDIIDFTLGLWYNADLLSKIRNYMKQGCEYYQIDYAINEFEGQVSKVLGGV